MAATGDVVGTVPGNRKAELALVHQTPLRVAEGELVTATVQIEIEPRLHITVPVGAYSLKDGTICFHPTVDVVGVTAVIMGIGVGALGVLKVAPVFRALAARIARR